MRDAVLSNSARIFEGGSFGPSRQRVARRSRVLKSHFARYSEGSDESAYDSQDAEEKADSSGRPKLPTLGMTALDRFSAPS